MGRLEGKVALITGGTSGIGEATVKQFVAEGAKVMIAGRSQHGYQLVEELGAATHYIQGDIANEPEVKRAISATVDAFGRLDILFNNAGGPTPSSVETVTETGFAHAMNLLLGSALYGMKHAAPIMRAQGFGRIINTTSVAGLRGHMGDYLYSMAKAALAHATRLAAIELGKDAITVNSIAPGAVATPIFFGGATVAASLEPGHAAAKMAKLQEALAKANPSHRCGSPEDVAHAAVFLASDAGAHVNGHDLVIDGGMIAGGRTNYE